MCIESFEPSECIENLEKLWQILERIENFLDIGKVLEAYSATDWKGILDYENPVGDYHRHLLFKSDRYVMYLIHWHDNSKESPIHAHPIDGCWMRVLHGKLHEIRYLPNTEIITQANDISKNQITFIHDGDAFHKIRPIVGHSVSLHIYGT